MEDVEERFIEVAVSPMHVEQAQALHPIDQRTMFGKTVMLFDGVKPGLLQPLGELHRPSVADLFVAVMKGEK